jgi:hypothetical protein
LNSETIAGCLGKSSSIEDANAVLLAGAIEMDSNETEQRWIADESGAKMPFTN